MTNPDEILTKILHQPVHFYPWLRKSPVKSKLSKFLWTFLAFKTENNGDLGYRFNHMKSIQIQFNFSALTVDILATFLVLGKLKVRRMSKRLVRH